MAKVTIGGVDYKAGALNFKALKRVWPHVSKMVDNPNETVEDGFEAMDLAVAIVAASVSRFHPEIDQDFIEENLMASEIKDIQVAMYEILRESGLIQTGESSGEAKSPSAKKKSSTGTSTQ